MQSPIVWSIWLTASLACSIGSPASAIKVVTAAGSSSLNHFSPSLGVCQTFARGCHSYFALTGPLPAAHETNQVGPQRGHTHCQNAAPVVSNQVDRLTDVFQLANDPVRVCFLCGREICREWRVEAWRSRPG